MKHSDMISKILPVNLGSVSDADIDIEGSMLDSVIAKFSEVLDEMFPSTAATTISRWESEYGLYNQSTSIESRRAFVRAKMIERLDLKKGGLRKGKFIEIAAALGYTIDIASSPDFFRADISFADDILYDEDVLYVMVVIVIGETSAPDLESLFTDIVPPYLRLEFIYQ